MEEGSVILPVASMVTDFLKLCQLGDFKGVNNLVYPVEPVSPRSDDEDADDMQTRLRITWDIIRSAAKLKWARPCLKRYLTSHVVGPALEVTPDHWDTVAMLPLARFEKQSVRQVYTESRKKVI